MSLADHLDALYAHGGRGVIDGIVVHGRSFPPDVLARYARAGAAARSRRSGTGARPGGLAHRGGSGEPQRAGPASSREARPCPGRGSSGTAAPRGAPGWPVPRPSGPTRTRRRPVPRETWAVVLAAGEGKRMRSSRPKVLHLLGGRPLIRYPVAARPGVRHRGDGGRRGAGRRRGPRRPWPTTALRFVEQAGAAGHGTRTPPRQAARVPATATELLLLYADVPLLARATLAALLGRHRAARAAATVLTFQPSRSHRVRADPPRPGRPGPRHRRGARRDAGRAARSRVQLGDLLLRPGPPLAGARGRARPARQCAGRVLPDRRDRGAGAPRRAGSSRPARRGSARGRRRQRPTAARRRSRRSSARAPSMRLMTAGRDDRRSGDDLRRHDRDRRPRHRAPSRASVSTAGPAIGEGCVIGTGLPAHRHRPSGTASRCAPTACSIAPGGDDATVGPFARLRRGSRIGAGRGDRRLHRDQAGHARAPGEGAPRGYMGDATVGEGANIGAGTITCNYDGVRKHQTRIGARAFVGTQHEPGRAPHHRRRRLRGRGLRDHPGRPRPEPWPSSGRRRTSRRAGPPGVGGARRRDSAPVDLGRGPG